MILPYEKIAYGWMAGWPYRRTCFQQCSTVYTLITMGVTRCLQPQHYNCGMYVTTAYVCSSNKSKNVLKFLRKYINTHGHPRNLQMDQATGFFSNEIQNFCNYEGHQISSKGSSRNGNGRTNNCVDKNYVLTCL